VAGNGAPVFNALLVGVDAYLPPPAGADSPIYPPLFGAVHDVERVDLYLREQLGVPAGNIEKLTASAGPGNSPGEPPERLPTCDNLVAALRRLGMRARPGEHVLFHYSGHGGRTPTAIPAIKGSAGLDECLVPWDIGHPEARYLRDNELFHLLTELVEGGIFVSMILDCCHAGGAIRKEQAIPGVSVRGIDEVDSTRRPPSTVASPEDLARTFNPLRGVRAERSQVASPRGYVLLAACRSVEVAREVPLAGWRPSGVLTHFFLTGLGEGGQGLSWRRLHDRLLPRVHGRFPFQTPVLEGEADRLVLGLEELPELAGIPVLAGDEKHPGGVRLAVGAAHGIGIGARLAIHRAASGVLAADTLLARAEVIEIEGSRCWASVVEPSPGARPPAAGDRARLTDPGAGHLRRPVRLLHRIPGRGPSRAWEQQPWAREAMTLSRLEEALREREGGFLERSGKGAERASSLAITVGDGGDYEILGADGLPAFQAAPPLPASDPGSPRRAVDRLLHVARYRNLWELENRDRSSPLRDALGITLGLLPDAYQPGEALEAERSLVPEGGGYRIRDGSKLVLTVASRAARPLNIVVLDLRPDGAVVQIFPTPAKGAFWSLDSEGEVRVPLVAELPEGMAEGVDLLKIVATLEPISFRGWELPPFGEEDHWDTVRGAGPGARPAPTSDLERFFATVLTEDSGPGPLRGGALGHDWTVAWREIRIEPISTHGGASCLSSQWRAGEARTSPGP